MEICSISYIALFINNRRCLNNALHLLSSLFLFLVQFFSDSCNRMKGDMFNLPVDRFFSLFTLRFILFLFFVYKCVCLVEFFLYHVSVSPFNNNEKCLFACAHSFHKVLNESKWEIYKHSNVMLLLLLLLLSLSLINIHFWSRCYLCLVYFSLSLARPQSLSLSLTFFLCVGACKWLIVSEYCALSMIWNSLMLVFSLSFIQRVCVCLCELGLCAHFSNM